MIRIEHLFITDYAQARGLLKHEPEPIPQEARCVYQDFLSGGLTFWQHWLPCQLHIAPSVYVAKEDGVIVGIISLSASGNSRCCWQVDHLIVHPHHRGRGIAQELLRFVFALFGSQGVNFFVTEIADLNSAALSLFSSCGFRRITKVSRYQAELRASAEPPQESEFRLAQSADQQGLFQLHQEVLPPDIRLIFSLDARDFAQKAASGASDGKIVPITRPRVWYWISADHERRILTAAAKVTAHREGDYHLEFAVHPGWSHQASGLVSFALGSLRRRGDCRVSVKVYDDFQASVSQSVEGAGLERAGAFCLMAREHWTRAKEPRKSRAERALNLSPITNPVVNFPLATERSRWTERLKPQSLK